MSTPESEYPENQLPNVRLLEALVNNAPALADDVEKARLLEWLCENDGDSARWDLAKSYQYEHPDFLDALRAAKEDADAKA